MTIPSDAPKWLKDADTTDADVSMVNGHVEWNDGEWNGGMWNDGVWNGGWWRGGMWNGGEWNGGVWLGGVWHDGMWNGGEWRGGEWLGGRWLGGVWPDGMWNDGRWLGGEWNDPLIPDRVAYHSSLLGIVFGGDGRAVAYRSTKADGTGRYNADFTQRSGRVDVGHAHAGDGTCVAGLHATTAAGAWKYFGVDPSAQLWRIEFERADLLDCDGQKVRLRGGWCEPIPWPWAAQDD